MRKVLFIFGDLSDGDVEWLAAVGQKRKFPAGSTLVHEGRQLEEVFILLDGQLTVLVQTSRDQQLTINTLQKGEIVANYHFWIRGRRRRQ